MSTAQEWREVGGQMAASHAYMGDPPKGSSVWIGEALIEAADTIESMVARGALAMDDWIGDAESIIHQHCNSDGSDDAHNDWVHDIASELWRHLGDDR